MTNDTSILQLQEVTMRFGGVTALEGVSFSIESGEMTPTLKVKRRVIEQRYSGLIDALYRTGEIPPRPPNDA